MKISRIVIAVLTVSVIATSCKFPFVKRSSLEASQSEAQAVKDTLKTVQESYARQTEELGAILAELTTLSNRTNSLQIQSESSAQTLTQAEEINLNLDELRERIGKLEKEAERARKLDRKLAISAKTIKELKETLAIQQLEIDTLKENLAKSEETIKDQKDIISKQSNKIADQQNTISSQAADIKALLGKQTDMLFQAAEDFEKLADDDEQILKVWGRSNKNKVIEYKKLMYGKAVTLYKQAEESGKSEAAERISSIAEKISALK